MTPADAQEIYDAAHAAGCTISEAWQAVIDEIERESSRECDWPQIIGDLNRAGVSLYKIGLAFAVDWHTVRRWAEGKSEPPYSIGVLLRRWRDDAACDPAVWRWTRKNTTT